MGLKSATMLLRYAASSPLKLPDPLHRVAKAQRYRPTDFLTRHIHNNGVREYRVDTAQDANPFRGHCREHGRHETFEGRYVRRTRGSASSAGEKGGKMDGVSSGRPQSLWHQDRPVDDDCPVQRGGKQGSKTRSGTIRGRESQRCTMMCKSMSGRDGKS